MNDIHKHLLHQIIYSVIECINEEQWMLIAQGGKIFFSENWHMHLLAMVSSEFSRVIQYNTVHRTNITKLINTKLDLWYENHARNGRSLFRWFFFISKYRKSLVAENERTKQNKNWFNFEFYFVRMVHFAVDNLQII